MEIIRKWCTKSSEIANKKYALYQAKRNKKCIKNKCDFCVFKIKYVYRNKGSSEINKINEEWNSLADLQELGLAIRAKRSQTASIGSSEEEPDFFCVLNHVENYSDKYKFCPDMMTKYPGVKYPEITEFKISDMIAIREMRTNITVVKRFEKIAIFLAVTSILITIVNIVW